MTYQKIAVETRDNVGIVRLNDPTTLNAVGPAASTDRGQIPVSRVSRRVCRRAARRERRTNCFDGYLSGRGYRSSCQVHNNFANMIATF
jgi:hypothetical protein